jgi:hypothetical protein
MNNKGMQAGIKRATNVNTRASVLHSPHTHLFGGCCDCCAERLAAAPLQEDLALDIERAAWSDLSTITCSAHAGNTRQRRRCAARLCHSAALPGSVWRPGCARASCVTIAMLNHTDTSRRYTVLCVPLAQGLGVELCSPLGCVHVSLFVTRLKATPALLGLHALSARTITVHCQNLLHTAAIESALAGGRLQPAQSVHARALQKAEESHRAPY